MRDLPSEADVLAKLVAWGAAQASIRAMLLTSSRARPGGPVDILSDYDIVVAATDAERFGQDTSWLNDYDSPIVRWGDEGELLGEITYFRSAVYADYVKIDYTIWPAALLQAIADSPRLPEPLDEGYRVLLDKDGVTAAWKLPTHRAFLPTPPTEAEYQALVEEFWWVATYVAKSLWRGEFWFARWVLFGDLRDGALRRLLEWGIALDHDWSLRPGVHGRGLEAHLPADWQNGRDVSGDDSACELWDTLWQTIALLRQVAGEIAGRLGFVYPQAMDDHVSVFLHDIQQMPPSPTHAS